MVSLESIIPIIDSTIFELTTQVTGPDQRKYTPTYTLFSRWYNGGQVDIDLLVDETIVGKMELHFKVNYVYIHSMGNLKRNEFKGVGRALHEIAIRYSFLVGFDGQVKLYPDYGASLFHYACGYRFQPEKEQVSRAIYYSIEARQVYHLLKESEFADLDALNTISSLVKKRLQLEREPTTQEIQVEFETQESIYSLMDTCLSSKERKELKTLQYLDRGGMHLSDETRKEWRTRIQKN